MGNRSRLAALFAVLATALPASTGARADVDPSRILVVPYDQLKFEGKPGQSQTAVLFGDPNKEGSWYGEVVKWPPHTHSRPHSHLHDRYVVVLSGTWWVSSDAKFSLDTMTPMKPGTYVTDLAGQIHYDGAKDEEAVIYIVGMGTQKGFSREEK
jgi:quercetin dioxygenase-like cupin family protein